MKTNSLLVSLLVISTLLYQAQGIRLGRISISSSPNHDTQEKGKMVIKGSTIKGGTGKEIICKNDEINCSGTTMQKSSISRVVNNKESHHWFPKIHEDYYGPRIHSPRHH